jgi:hypothetical protein
VKNAHGTSADATTISPSSKRHRTGAAEMSGVTRENHWQRMPIELVTKICEHLDVPSLRQLRRVNRSFRHFVDNHDLLWKRVVLHSSVPEFHDWLCKNVDAWREFACRRDARDAYLASVTPTAQEFTAYFMVGGNKDYSSWYTFVMLPHHNSNVLYHLLWEKTSGYMQLLKCDARSPGAAPVHTARLTMTTPRVLSCVYHAIVSNDGETMFSLVGGHFSSTLHLFEWSVETGEQIREHVFGFPFKRVNYMPVLLKSHLVIILEEYGGGDALYEFPLAEGASWLHASRRPLLDYGEIYGEPLMDNQFLTNYQDDDYNHSLVLVDMPTFQVSRVFHQFPEEVFQTFSTVMVDRGIVYAVSYDGNRKRYDKIWIFQLHSGQLLKTICLDELKEKHSLDVDSWGYMLFDPHYVRLRLQSTSTSWYEYDVLTDTLFSYAIPMLCEKVNCSFMDRMLLWSTLKPKVNEL